MAVLLDFSALAILGYSALVGWKKGLILTAAGFVATLLAIVIAWNLAAALAKPLGGWMEQYLAQTVGEVITMAAAEQDILPDVPALPTGELLSAAGTVMNSLGFSELGHNALADAVVRKVKEEGLSLKQSATATVCNAIAFSGVLVFGFLLLKAAFDAAVHAISKVAKLPGLHMLDSLGGIAFGALSGLAALLILGWALRFLGVLIPAETVASTSLMRFFTDSSLLDRLTVLLAAKI